jgi:phage anti-repressor protein
MSNLSNFISEIKYEKSMITKRAYNIFLNPTKSIESINKQDPNKQDLNKREFVKSSLSQDEKNDLCELIVEWEEYHKYEFGE